MNGTEIQVEKATPLSDLMRWVAKWSKEERAVRFTELIGALRLCETQLQAEALRLLRGAKPERKGANDE